MPCSYARTRIRRRCVVAAFFEARGAGAAEEPSAFLAVRARGARTFFTVVSAVIEPAEYALCELNLQANSGMPGDSPQMQNPRGEASCITENHGGEPWFSSTS